MVSGNNDEKRGRGVDYWRGMRQAQKAITMPEVSSQKEIGDLELCESVVIMAVWLKASTFCDGPVLPTKNLSAAVSWHTAHFGMQEVARTDTTVTLKRGGDADGSPEISLCFAVNGQDPENDGAAIRVQDAAVARAELETAGVSTGNWRVSEVLSVSVRSACQL